MVGLQPIRYFRSVLCNGVWLGCSDVRQLDLAFVPLFPSMIDKSKGVPFSDIDKYKACEKKVSSPQSVDNISAISKNTSYLGRITRRPAEPKIGTILLRSFFSDEGWGRATTRICSGTARRRNGSRCPGPCHIHDYLLMCWQFMTLQNRKPCFLVSIPSYKRSLLGEPNRQVLRQDHCSVSLVSAAASFFTE